MIRYVRDALKQALIDCLAIAITSLCDGPPPYRTGYQDGRRDGAEAERAKVRWLSESDAILAALALDLDDEALKTDGGECHHEGRCPECDLWRDCWRLRPGVRVGVVIEEGSK